MPKQVNRKWYIYEWEKKVAGKERNVCPLPGDHVNLAAAMQYVLDGGTWDGKPRLKDEHEVRNFLPNWLGAWTAHAPCSILPGHGVYIETERVQNKVVDIKGVQFDQIVNIDSRIEGNALICRVEYVCGFNDKTLKIDKKYIIFEAL